MAEEPTRMSDPDTGNRSPDEIRRDIERTRTDLHETVDAIERRLTPSELFDEFWGRMRGSGSSAGEVVKDHPVPLALMGLGLGWLAIEKATGSDSKASHRREDGPSVTWRPDRDSEDDSPGRIDRVKAKASSLKDSASHLGERASDAKDRVADAASSAGHRVSETASDAKEQVRETADHAMDRTREMARRAQDRFERITREQPLALGAITFGLGLAAGMMTPTTRWEDEHLGPASDAVKDTARETASEVKDVAREVAAEAKDVAREAKDSIEHSARDTEGRSVGARIGDAVDRARETVQYAAGEHGIDRDGLRERGRDIAEHTKDSLREARDDVSGPAPTHRPGDWSRAEGMHGSSRSPGTADRSREAQRSIDRPVRTQDVFDRTTRQDRDDRTRR